jgi:transcriptional regulator with XRE-family HTH domain
VAENLWALREQKKLSVAALANRAGLPISLIMEYEAGRRSIDPHHVGRLARAMYIEESQIKLQSDPRPGASSLERRSPAPEPAAAGRPPRPAEQPARPPRSRPEPKPPAPIQPSQLAHLEGLLKWLNRTPADLEAELGKPLAQLDRLTASNLLRTLQAQATIPKPAERHRAYLPESVDEFEARYLTAAQEVGDLLHFTLFDGSSAQGQVIGFGPYSITVRQPDGAELTLNKLALVSYKKVVAV